MVLEQYIQRIEEKLHLLLKKMQQVQAENVSLREELNTRQQQIQEQQGMIQGLEEKLQMVKIAATTQGTHSLAEDDEAFRKEIKGKINDYIKEIDRCIALLNA
ncbi:hypothetical protein [Chitinophaga sp. Cy-1792]|uniref:hypothetical protein n=1 Tax=Chitinophaga sp. Cy-1792 TaxID=2608339 RepID=UPI00141D7F7A|nr:hypothetical protein [Chitinophaga sp. Cy-1792]NIG53044.1 hypothetical protein [Chitinophaga sp. Cy-1792]